MKTSTGLAVTALALVVVSSSAGYSAGKITSAQIKNNTISSADIKNDTVSSADIKNGAISAADLNQALTRATTIGKAYAYVYPRYTGGESPVRLPPQLDKARSSGFVSVRDATDDGEPVLGIYCLKPAKGVDLSRSPVITSIEESQSASTSYRAEWSAQTFSCQSGEVEIRTYADSTEDELSTLSGTAAFTVFAP